MVTMTSADNALKSVYLGAVSEQLDTAINPLLAKIQRSTADVWGKEVRRLAHAAVHAVLREAAWARAPKRGICPPPRATITSSS